jgi:hypothetical protein
MSRPKTRQVGTAGLVTRYRNGTVMRTCRRCHQAEAPPSWRSALRAARAHARDHQATDARDVGTPWGIPAHELPPTRPAARQAHPLRRLAIAVVVLVLTALLLPALLGPLTSHAAPAPAPAAPSIAVVPTTIKPAPTTKPAPHRPPTTEGYVPTPAGPPASSSDAGGGR